MNGYECEDCPAAWARLVIENNNCGGDAQSPIAFSSRDTSRSSIVLNVNYDADVEVTKEDLATNVEYRDEDPGENEIIFGDVTYVFDQFHFHTTAEHVVNGERSALEMHFVYKSATGSILVLGIFIWEGEFDPGCFNQTVGNQIVVLPDGTLVNFFNEIISVLSIDPFTPNPEPPNNLALLRSFDRGETWESTSTKVELIRANAVNTPDTGDPVRDASFLFDVAVDPQDDTLYAVWQDARFFQPALEVDQIAFAVSKDGGDTWSEPVRINRTPPTPNNPLRQQAFIPSVTVAPSGAVAVTYYDFRNDEDGPRELADHFMVICQAECDNPDRFEREIRLTERSFDYREAAETGAGLFLGDYLGLDASRRAFLRKDADGFFRRVNRRVRAP